MLRFLLPFLIAGFVCSGYAQGTDTLAVTSDTIAPAYLSDQNFTVANKILNEHFDYSRYKNNINIYGEWYSNSNSVTHAFANDLIFKRFIDNEVKETASGKLKDNNVLGSEITGGVSYMRRLDSFLGGNTFLIAKYSYHHFLNAEFHPDVFELIFRGNAHFEDQTAMLNPLYYRQLVYSQFQLGLYKLITTENASEIGLGIIISGNQGYDYALLRSTIGSLYTSPGGQYLDLELSGDATFSDTSNFGNTSWNGTGVSLDLIFTYSKNFDLKLEMQDLGYITYNDKTTTFTADTAFRFSGFDASDLFSGANIFDQADVDSLMTLLNISGNQQEERVFLPTTARITFGKDLNDWRIEGGVQHRFIHSYKPLIFGELHRQFPGINANAGLSLSYGGFGNFNIGMEVSKQFMERFYLKIGSASLVSYIIPQQLPGASAYFLLGASF